MNTIFRGVALRGEALIRGRCLFQCGYPKVQHLLEGCTYKYDLHQAIKICKVHHFADDTNLL